MSLKHKKTSTKLVFFLGALSGLILYLFTSTASVLTYIIGCLGVYMAGSVTGFVTFSTLSLVIFSFIFKVISFFPFSLPLNRQSYAMALCIVLLYCSLTKMWRMKILLRDELSSILIGFAVLIFSFEVKLIKPTGSISALFAHEDNAAWILASNKIEHTSDSAVGIFGSFVDLVFFLGQKISGLYFTNLNEADRTATAITLLCSLVLIALPFLCYSAMSTNRKTSVSQLKLTILQIGSILIWLHFQSVGHLTAGIAAIGILLVSVRATETAIENIQTTQGGVVVLLIILTTIGQTWFPIIPLSVALMIYLGFSQTELHHGKKIRKLLFAITSSLYLISTEAIPRFNIFRDENGSIFSGAANLVQMEGGVAGTHPFTTEVVLAVLIVVMLMIGALKVFDLSSTLPIILCWSYLLLIRTFNIIISEGTVNYGVRKIESLVLLVTLIYVLFLFASVIQRLNKDRKVSLYIGLPIIGLLLQLPISNQFLGRNLFPGLSNGDYRAIATAISDNVSNGVSALCINEQREEQPFSELRLLAYTCSRFVAAYGDSDNNLKNEWRKAVLGSIRYEDLPQVRDQLGDNNLLIRVGPTNPNLSDNVDWPQLVNESWRQITANS